MHKVFKPGETPKDYNFEEMCPECGNYIPVLVDNDEAICYQVSCPVCGYEMMLCTLCRWDQEEEEGFTDHKCDWSQERGCFRRCKS